MSYDFACTVTGANGFVGRNLVRALMAQSDFGVRVFGVDVTKGDNLPEEVTHSGITNRYSFHRGDVTQPLDIDLLAVDAVYHFAGIADPSKYITDPLRVMDLNIFGLRNILERVAQWSPHVRPRVVYSSTSEVYGQNVDVPFSEDTSKMVFGQGMRWCYALSKAVGEKYLQGYSMHHGIRHTTFRFFNLVGPDIDAVGGGRVLTSMVGQALDHGYVKVTAPGLQTRSFTHIDDAVVVLMRAMWQRDMDRPRWEQDHIVNLGNDEEISMSDLASIVLVTLGLDRQSQRFFSPTELFGEGYEDIPRRQPDTSFAKMLFGWEPRRKQHEFLPEIVKMIAERRRDEERSDR